MIMRGRARRQHIAACVETRKKGWNEFGATKGSQRWPMGSDIGVGVGICLARKRSSDLERRTEKSRNRRVSGVSNS